MILFFRTPQQSVIATAVDHQLNQDEINELIRKADDLLYTVKMGEKGHYKFI